MAEDTKALVGLSPAQVQQVRAWIDSHWVHKNCPMCTVVDWKVGGYLTQAPTLKRRDYEVLNYEIDMYWGFQSVPIFCGNCGLTLYVNAILVGVMPRAKNPN